MIGTHYIFKEDLFYIAARIKEIDEGYFIAYNYKLKRLEVHNKNQRGNSLCIVSPFKTLDCRLLNHIRRTRVERKKQLIEELEFQNNLLERDRLNNIKRKAENLLEDAYKKV